MSQSAVANSACCAQGDSKSPCRGGCIVARKISTVLRQPRGLCFGQVPRSTVGATEAIPLHPSLCVFGVLLVPRGGIEPPTRGFSVPSSPSGRASFPLGTSVKLPARPVKPGTPKHGHARSAQFSMASLGTRPNSFRLLETSVSFRATACAAISVSSGPMGLPRG
jgi:hypothetical protein